MADSGQVAEMTEGHAERRKERRFACRGFAEVLVPGLSLLFRGAVLDLSQAGCYISSLAQLSLPRGTEVEVILILDCDQLTLLARVALIRPGKGAGFEFCDVDAPTGKRLARWIKNLNRSGYDPDAPRDNAGCGLDRREEVRA
jgi:hypothetical protein